MAQSQTRIGKTTSSKHVTPESSFRIAEADEMQGLRRLVEQELDANEGVINTNEAAGLISERFARVAPACGELCGRTISIDGCSQTSGDGEMVVTCPSFYSAEPNYLVSLRDRCSATHEEIISTLPDFADGVLSKAAHMLERAEGLNGLAESILEQYRSQR